MISAIARPTARNSSSRVSSTPSKTLVNCTSRNQRRSVYASIPQPSSVNRRKTPTRTPTVTRPRRLILGRGLFRMTNVGSHGGIQHYAVQGLRGAGHGRATRGEGLHGGERVVHGGDLGHRQAGH